MVESCYANLFGVYVCGDFYNSVDSRDQKEDVGGFGDGLGYGWGEYYWVRGVRGEGEGEGGGGVGGEWWRGEMSWLYNVRGHNT